MNSKEIERRFWKNLYFHIAQSNIEWGNKSLQRAIRVRREGVGRFQKNQNLNFVYTLKIRRNRWSRRPLLFGINKKGGRNGDSRQINRNLFKKTSPFFLIWVKKSISGPLKSILKPKKRSLLILICKKIKMGTELITHKSL